VLVDQSQISSKQNKLQKINWANIDVPFISKSTYSGILVNLLIKLAFQQFVSEPTRFNTVKHYSSILDLVLCNNFNFVHGTCVDARRSDYSVVNFKSNNNIAPFNAETTSHDFKGVVIF